MKPTTVLAAALLVALASSPVHSQAEFVEDFESLGAVPGGAFGPQGLLDRGWRFRNQSDPLGSRGFFPGALLTPYEGTGYLAVDSTSTDFFGGDVSSWALLPAVGDQVAGDVVTLQAQRVSSDNADRLEVRYSPSGGTSTGSSATDVGDFSVLLASSTPTAGGWETISAVLPGSGRIAIRYVVPGACNFACASSHVGLDLLSVGAPPTPACNLPPLPGPGQTVSWTKAGSPWEICADVAIPAGGTVVVEAGATLVVDPTSTLTVLGTLRMEGTAADPILLQKPGLAPAIDVQGSARLEWVDVQGQLHALHGGSLEVYDASFSGVGLSTDDSVGGSDHGTYVQVERTIVTGGTLAVTDGTLVVRETDLLNGDLSVLRGYLLVDDVTVDGGGLAFYRERFTQPTLLDRLSVLNAPGPALTLSGWDFLVGPATTLQNNALPVNLIGGLLPGSNVPGAGNLANYVDVGTGGLVGSGTWAALPAPYRVTSSGSVGGASIEVEAGATIEFAPGVSVIHYAGSVLRARGRAGAPVTFRAADPVQGWNRLKFQSHDGTALFEHCVFEDAQVALQSDNANLWVNASIFQDNQVGLWTNTGGLMRARGTRLLNNGVGAHEESGSMDLNGATGPNSLVGNGIGVEGGDGDARFNWWGDPSGPSHASNPGGAGDAATAAVQVLPFRTTAPGHADAPPRVELARPYGLLDAGSRIQLRWDVEDDGRVVSQRILFSEHGRSGFVELVGELAGGVRTYEVEVPKAFPSSITSPSYFRVVAVDDAGQEGLDEWAVRIPYTDDLAPATLTFLTDFSAGFTFGEEVQVDWVQSGMSGTWGCAVVADGDGSGVGFGGGTTAIETWTVRMPYVSTDSARIALSFNLGAGGRTRTFYSEEFTIRPDARLPDAPPTIRLLSPAPGQSFEGGGIVPVSWTAGDDEGLRAIRLQASFDGGRTWQPVAELPGTATGHPWSLPASSGIADVRLRAVAVDRRFQNSSSQVPLSIEPGAGGGAKAWLRRLPAGSAPR